MTTVALIYQNHFMQADTAPPNTIQKVATANRKEKTLEAIRLAKLEHEYLLTLPLIISRLKESGKYTEHAERCLNVVYEKCFGFKKAKDIAKKWPGERLKDFTIIDWKTKGVDMIIQLADQSSIVISNKLREHLRSRSIKTDPNIEALSDEDPTEKLLRSIRRFVIDGLKQAIGQNNEITFSDDDVTSIIDKTSKAKLKDETVKGLYGYVYIVIRNWTAGQVRVPCHNICRKWKFKEGLDFKV